MTHSHLQFKPIAELWSYVLCRAQSYLLRNFYSCLWTLDCENSWCGLDYLFLPHQCTIYPEKPGVVLLSVSSTPNSGAISLRREQLVKKTLASPLFSNSTKCLARRLTKCNYNKYTSRHGIFIEKCNQANYSGEEATSKNTKNTA